MSWTDYAAAFAQSHAGEIREVIPHPAQSFAAELLHGDGNAMRAFCGWVAWHERDRDIEAFVDSAEDFVKLQGTELYDQIAVMLAPLPRFAHLVGESDFCEGLELAYAEFLVDFEFEWVNVAEGYASLTEPVKPKFRMRDSRVPHTPVGQAFVCGHGSYVESAQSVRVPPGMTLRFMSRADELLLMWNSFAVLSDGPAAKSYQDYQAGELVPNYHFSPETTDCDAALALQANIRDMPLYFIGDTTWDSSGADSSLCTQPEKCLATKDGTHVCKGVLATLGQVQQLHFMTCRGRSGDSKAKPTHRLPGESLPLNYAKLGVLGATANINSDDGLVRRLKELDCTDPATMAQMLVNPDVQRRLEIISARELFMTDGHIVYYGKYLNSSKKERKWLDSDEELVTAKKLAEEFIEKFTVADSDVRALMLSDLYRLMETAGWNSKTTLSFLAYRIPGFNTWRRNATYYTEMVDCIREPLKVGGHYQGVFANGGLILQDGPGVGAYSRQILKAFAEGMHFSVELKPPKPSQPEYFVMGSVGSHELSQPVKNALTGLIEVVLGKGVQVQYMD
ncbi:putative adhesin [Streptomyces erythrochromogenes]|uniref:putative adhesin n=1 Tax=Streptomyces erythrochromogenes TaxID=285574 RepID=UPI0034172755